MFVFVHQRGSGPIRPGPSDFFLPVWILLSLSFLRRKGRGIFVLLLALRLVPPIPSRRARCSTEATPGQPRGSSPPGRLHAARQSGPFAVQQCTKQLASGAAAPCCVQHPAKNEGIVPSGPGGAGLRGCSGRAVRAAGPAVRRNLPRSFLCRKDGKNPYQLPQPGDLSYTLPMG